MDVPSSSNSSPNEGDGAPTHFLVELVTLDHLMMTSSVSKRSKLTCIAVSPQFLIVGTSTGGVSVYGRYSSSRKRLNAPSGPLHFINTKDGPVSSMCVAPKEGLIAVGNDSGRIHAIEFSTSPSPVKHLLTRDTRRLKKVTSLIWSTDSKRLYSGHENGAVVVHYLDAKYLFRSSYAIVATLDEGPIVQLDVSGSIVLVSTQCASYICRVDDKNVVQIGKKPRNAPMGACFISPAHEDLSIAQRDVFIMTARPNGRVWEANTAGVVYRTHQLRESVMFSRSPVISTRYNYSSFRKKLESGPTEVSDAIALSVLQHIIIDGVSFVLSVSGSCLIVFDVEQSKLVLVSDLEEEICGCCVCGADIFVLLRGIAIPRKYTLCSRTAVVKRLLAKSLPAQSAQFMLHYKGCEWPPDLIRTALDALGQSTKKVELDLLKSELSELLGTRSRHPSRETHDSAAAASCSPGNPEVEGGEIHEADKAAKLPSRSRRVRARSSSYDTANAARGTARKRASFPQCAEDTRCSMLRCGFNQLNDEREAKKVLSHSQNPRCRIVGSESLRTLLQMHNPNVVDAVQFVPTVTLGNAAKSLAELAIATPASFSYMAPADNDLSTHMMSTTVVKRRTGPSIVKAVKPSNKVKPVASVRPLVSEHLSESSTNLVLDKDHNHVNARILGDSSLSSEKKVSATSIHDDENNMETLDKQWVIDRIAQLRSKTYCSDRSPSPDNENTKTNNSFVENTASTTSLSSIAIDERCDQCRIHKSWLVAAMMVKVCKRVKITYNNVNSGAIPVTRDDWKKLLTYRLSSREALRSPCIRCETALSRCLTIFRKSQEALDLFPDNVRPNPKKMHERCISLNEERMRSTLFDSLVQSSIRSSAKSPVENGVYENHSYANMAGTDSPKIEKEDKSLDESGTISQSLNEMDWILAVDARVVFALASIVIGYRELMLIFKENSFLLKTLSTEHWTTLSLLGIRDQALKRDEVNSEIISETLRGLNLTTFDIISLRTNNLVRRDGQSQAPMYSWIIDCSGSCPVCTLNLKSDIGSKDLSVTSFVCGHAYHTICLARRPGGCLMCRGRKKSANVSRPPHISRT
ncbi:hypothetical protein V3C99_004553 [Haemonchus contortus]